MATQQSNATQSAAALSESDVLATFAQFNKQVGTSGDSEKQTTAAVKALIALALEKEKLIGRDVIEKIQLLVAEIDQRLTRQINEILHHASFQKLEGSWRGLHYLVNNTMTDEKLKIRVMNAPKDEVGNMLERFKGARWDQSPLFKKLYDEEYGQLGGEPYGALVGDYHFDHGSSDMAFLGEMAKIAAAAHAPFIAGASPGLLKMKDWRELSSKEQVAKIFNSADFAAWRALRESEDSRYLGLSAPRFLAREPWGGKYKKVDEFAFEEDTAGSGAEKFVWANSAYAMATRINASFKESGWCTQIRGAKSGGTVEDLPLHTFPTDDGGVDMTCPTEIAISDRRSFELDKAGLISLTHRKNSNEAVFIAAQSVHKPKAYTNDDATKNAELGARLPYIFAVSRFAHYLKVMVRENIGMMKSRADMQRWLNEWIMNFVISDPSGVSDKVKAERPLSDASVVVEEDETNPGFYRAKFSMTPHYQLEGVNVSMSLASKMPEVPQG